MIYLGLIHFNQTPDVLKKLKQSIENFADSRSTMLKREFLTLFYGKLSVQQDLDDVWENETSICLGRVFDKKSHCSFKREKFKDLTHLNTKEILEKIWGKYVCFNFNKETSQIEVVLDSTGQLPFFYFTYPNGNILFSSNIEILYKALDKKPDFDWNYLCSYLVYGNTSSVQTPFKGIKELPPACGLTITKNKRETAPSWNPLQSYAQKNTRQNDTVCALQTALKPWIQPYQNICVSLSGGLDSSALVYCLKDIMLKDQNLKALNFFHSQIKSSNELSHARQICKETGIDLIEIDLLNALPFDSPQGKHMLKPNKPSPGLVSLRWQEMIYDNLPTGGPTSFISGHGSDHIFMRPPTKKSVLDYILAKGIKGSKDKFKGIADFYRDPIFSILKENLKVLPSYLLGIKRQKGSTQLQTNDISKWILQKAINNAHVSSHPIYDSLPKKILPGKFDQIDAVYEGLNSIHTDMVGQSDPIYYPFLYQPVVDHALSFSTYDLFDKGYDRYPLRKSINDSFNTKIAWRRDKSETTGIFQLGVKKNIKQILDLCLGGHFVSEGLIDQNLLHSSITLIENGDVKNMWPLMHLVSTEIFIRHWQEKIS